MYKRQIISRKTIQVNQATEGETIEKKVSRITNNKEPITDGAPLIYTERSEGVKPGYDIRTDRFEIAVDAMDKVNKTERAKNEGKGKAPVIKMEDKPKEEAGKPGENTADQPK